MQSSSRAPVLSATFRRDSCWIMALLGLLDDLGEAPVLRLGQRPRLDDADDVALLRLVLLVVRVELLRPADNLLVARMRLDGLHLDDDRLVHRARDDDAAPLLAATAIGLGLRRPRDRLALGGTLARRFRPLTAQRARDALLLALRLRPGRGLDGGGGLLGGRLFGHRLLGDGLLGHRLLGDGLLGHGLLGGRLLGGRILGGSLLGDGLLGRRFLGHGLLGGRLCSRRLLSGRLLGHRLLVGSSLRHRLGGCGLLVLGRGGLGGRLFDGRLLLRLGLCARALRLLGRLGRRSLRLRLLRLSLLNLFVLVGVFLRHYLVPSVLSRSLRTVRMRAISRFASLRRAGFSSAPVADWKRRLNSSCRLSASAFSSSSSVMSLSCLAFIRTGPPLASRTSS